MEAWHLFTSIVLIAFCVGLIVGMTGMGGGALMTPALIFVGVPPTVAVANDLVAAVLHKSVAAKVHYSRGTPDMAIVGWLILGSVPAAFVGASLASALARISGLNVEESLKFLIGLAITFTAIVFFVQNYVSSKTGYEWRPTQILRRQRRLATVFVGVVGGATVGITSVGSGSLIMAALIVIYGRMPVRILVGTDLVQALPIVAAAALGHILFTGVDWQVLAPLLLGSAPGAFIGSKLATKIDETIIAKSVVIMLSVTGLALLGVPPTVFLCVGIVLAVLIPPRMPLWHRRTV